jgi:hypothetical protein
MAYTAYMSYSEGQTERLNGPMEQTTHGRSRLPYLAGADRGGGAGDDRVRQALARSPVAGDRLLAEPEPEPGPAGPPKCPACGYNLYFAERRRCPECGRTFEIKELDMRLASWDGDVLRPRQPTMEEKRQEGSGMGGSEE